MATAAETTAILQLIAGMVNASPGRTILTELEGILDSGLTVKEMAIAISNNPDYSGDNGLFPDFLPNAIFAKNFVTQLLGDNVTEAVLETAIDDFTATLNADPELSRGAAVYDAIIALAETEDEDFADAQSALANKVEVSEYYSVTIERSGETLEELIAVVSGVAAGEDGVDDGIDAVDSLIVGATELSGLLGNLDAANQAITDYLKAIKVSSADTVEALEGARALAVQTAGATGFVAAGENTRPGLIEDTKVTLAKAITTAGKGVTAATTATDAVTGLTAAVGVKIAADAALATATKDGNVAFNTFASAMLEYDAAKTGQAAAIANAALAKIASVTDGATPIIITSSTTGLLKLATGVSEATNTGVDALLDAALAHNVVVSAYDTAVTVADDATKVVENLDLSPGRTIDLAALSLEMDLTPPTVATAAQIKAAFLTLPENLTDANAAAVAALGAADPLGAANLLASVALIDAAIGAVVYDTDDATTAAAQAAITTSAVTLGLLTSAEKTLIDTAFADGLTGAALGTSIADAQAALATENAHAKDAAFTVVYNAYQAEDIATTGLASVPLSNALITASLGVTAATEAAAAFDKAVSDWETINGAEETIATLEKAVAAAKADIIEKGVEKLVDAEGTVVAGTDDELFIAVDEDSTIINMDDTDLVYLGDGLTLNEDDTAGDEGDNAVLEYWVTTVAGNTVITVEKTEFGSEAAEPETFAITLSGIAEADVSIADGVLSIA